MATNPIQWFPGHMAKTKRMISECLGSVDIILELLDARIPYSSKNPDIEKITSGKPKLTVLTKTSLADPEINKLWAKHFEEKGECALFIDSSDGIGLKELSDAVKKALKSKLDRYNEKGMEGRRLKAMIVGIPNVGKSSLINKLSGAKRAIAMLGGRGARVESVSLTAKGLETLTHPMIIVDKSERTPKNLPRAFAQISKKPL